MAKVTKKSWSAQDYVNEAREFVACYGRDYCWEEFVYEYIDTWDSRLAGLPPPDGELLLSAIRTEVRSGAKSHTIEVY